MMLTIKKKNLIEVRGMLSGNNAVKRLAMERPDWLPIVEACLEEAKRTRGEFAGAWVLKRARQKGIPWFPNLRILVSYGILKHEDTTRGGRRAYYIMPDPEGVEMAMRELAKTISAGSDINN